MTRLNFYLLCFALMAFTNCKTNQPKTVPTPKAGMFKVAILYPGGEDKSFDMSYYERKHMPMMAEFLGKNLFFYEIDKGIAGRTPKDNVPFVAVGYFYINDTAAYNKVIEKNIAVILDDIKKYTNIQPTIQISEIRELR